tara:strand:+ start:2180 stop:2911 length:732 start_codon:yes stop_codon:yes gene_type:complete
MAAPQTLDDMRTRVRELANMETQAASGFVTDDELRRRLNEALKHLYDMLIEARGQEYYLKQHTFALVSGQNDYNLPADFYEGASVTATNNGYHYQLRTWEMQELAAMQSLSVQTSGSIYSLRYRFKGPDIPAGLNNNRITIYPTPSQGFTVNVWYIPAMTELVLGTDTFNGVNGWEQWAVLTAAIDILNKEESDTSALMIERNMVETRIRKLAGNQDAGHASRITDVRGDWLAWPLWTNNWNA